MSCNNQVEACPNTTVDLIWGCIGLVVGLVAGLLNALLAFVFMKLKRKGSVNDVIFLQLATLDCLSSVAGLFGSIFLINNRRWFKEDSIAGSILCYPPGMLWNMASLTTPLLLGSASFGRLLAVYTPFAYEQIFQSRKVMMMMGYCWTHGILASTISLMGDVSNEKGYMMYHDWGYCDQSINSAFSSKILRKALYITVFTVPVIVACAMIIVCNVLVAFKLLLMKLRSKSQASSSSNADGTSVVMVAEYVKTFKLRNAKFLVSPLRRKNNSKIRSSVASSHSTHTIEENCTNSNNSVEVNGSKLGNIDEHARMSVSMDMKGTIQERKQTKRKRRENKAILMTLLLSCNYFLCYIEIIHYYVIVSIYPNDQFAKYYTPIFKDVTYVYLWYYFSLFVAAAINPLLQLFFNPNVKQYLNGVRKSWETGSSST